MDAGDAARLTGPITYDPVASPDWALVEEGTEVEITNHVREWAVRIRVDTDDLDETEGRVDEKTDLILEVTEDDLEVTE